MPGIISPLSAGSVGDLAGMKRTHPDAQPPHGATQQPTKKRKVVHQIRYAQPIGHIIEDTSAEIDPTGEHKEFFDHQLKRAIAIQCKAAGFDTARPEVLESFRNMVDQYMQNFTTQVRKSMMSARRTETVAFDWIYALTSCGLRGSGELEEHLDTGEVPTTLLQPDFPPPETAEPPPPDLEGLLGSELSGKAEKESKAYIPKHFPPFPSKHTYKATPVFTERENDPRKIREKATEEGILAEQSLRKLMAAQKAGLQSNKAGKRRKSKRMKENDKLWKAAMEDVLAEEADRAQKEQERQRAEDAMEDDDEQAPLALRKDDKLEEKKAKLEEGVHVNYDQKFYRRSARGF